MAAFAFVFPGQGSQSVGMLDAWGDHPVIRDTLAEGSHALGQDLAALIRSGPKESLALTINTQPVMLVSAVAIFRAWIAETDKYPAVVAGHSLGEYTALVASGALTLEQATPLVRFRAQAMQDAVPVGSGAMAAVLGLPAAQVVAACAQVQASYPATSPEVVEAANFNDPLQTVISGTRMAVEKACEVLKSMGAKRALLLPVSAPFHSSLMRPAAQQLQERLLKENLRVPQIPLVNNVDAALEADPARIRDALVRQASGAVRWVECVEAIKRQGIAHVIECGPGKVLAGTVKRIDGSLVTASLCDPASLSELKELLA